MRKLSQMIVVVLAVCLLAAMASAEPTKLSFLFRGGTQQEEIVKYWINDFQKQNPDIVIEWSVPPSDWATKLPVLVATGTGPDVIEMWGAEARDWGETGVLVDLDPYVKRDFKQSDINDFFPMSWQVGVINYGPKKGMRFGLPAYGNIYTFYYNKTLFAEAGVPPIPTLDKMGEWTWDGLVKYGKKLTKYNGTDIVQYALNDNSLHNPTARGAGWVAANGGKIFDLPNNPTKFMMDMPETIEAFQFLQDLMFKYDITPPYALQSKYPFNKGMSAMMMEGTGYLSRFIEQFNGTYDFDLAVRPMGKVSRGYYLASDMWAITSSSPHKEQAWRFVKYLTSKEGAEAYARIMSRGPIRKSAFPAYQKAYSNYNIQVYVDGMMDATISPETQMYKVKEAREGLIWKARDKIEKNQLDVKQAISEIAEAVRALYK